MASLGSQILDKFRTREHPFSAKMYLKREAVMLRTDCVFEFLGNSLTQTKQKFIRLYYLDCWIQIVQFDEQNKMLNKIYCVK